MRLVRWLSGWLLVVSVAVSVIGCGGESPAPKTHDDHADHSHDDAGHGQPGHKHSE